MNESSQRPNIRDKRQRGWFWADNVLIDHYAAIVGPSAMLVYMALVRHTDAGTQQCFPSVRYLRDKLAMSKTTILKAIGILTHAGLLHVTVRQSSIGDPESNLYTLLQPSWGVVQEMDHVVQHVDHGGTGDGLGVVQEMDLNKTHKEQDPLNKEKTLSSETPDEESVSGQPAVSTEGTTTMEDLLQGWRDLCVPEGLPAKRVITDALKRKIKARLKEHPTEAFWQTVFDRLCASNFLTGRTTGWRASLDWLMKNSDNCVKVYEGGYRNVRKA